jgi:uncharacterized damage-inducible protein DinB
LSSPGLTSRAQGSIAMQNTDLLTAYAAGPATLRAAVRDLTAEQLRARPISGQWSTLEVVCHLADAEALFAERMKRVLCENRPALLYSDPTNQPSVLVYHERDLDEELRLIELLRAQMTRILRTQPESAWQRVGVHSKEGERTLEQLLRKGVEHLQHHVAFIDAKRRVLFASGQ